MLSWGLQWFWNKLSDLSNKWTACHDRTQNCKRRQYYSIVPYNSASGNRFLESELFTSHAWMNAKSFTWVSVSNVCPVLGQNSLTWAHFIFPKRLISKIWELVCFHFAVWFHHLCSYRRCSWANTRFLRQSRVRMSSLCEKCWWTNTFAIYLHRGNRTNGGERNKIKFDNFITSDLGQQTEVL